MRTTPTIGAAELLLRILQPRFRLRDLGRELGDLLRAHSGIDVVTISGRRGQRRARLRDRRGQLDCRQLGEHIAGADAIALANLDGCELAADLGRDADLGRAHDPDDRRGWFGAPEEVCIDADHGEDDAERDEACGPAVSHVPACV